MPKLQCEVPNALDAVIARVQVRTHAKGIALTYLLYLAKQVPLFPKKNYGNGREKNCTLGMVSDTYDADFATYRTAQDPVLVFQNRFFLDALTRGASMYEAGYRLSSFRTPDTATLQADGQWRDAAAKAGAMLDFAADPSVPYGQLLDARQAHSSVEKAAFHLLDRFARHHAEKEIAAQKETFEAMLSVFEQGLMPERLRKLAAEFAAYIADPANELTKFADWDALPSLPRNATRKRS